MSLSFSTSSAMKSTTPPSVYLCLSDESSSHPELRNLSKVKFSVHLDKLLHPTEPTMQPQWTKSVARRLLPELYEHLISFSTWTTPEAQGELEQQLQELAEIVRSNNPRALKFAVNTYTNRVHGTEQFQHALVEARSTSSDLDYTAYLVGPALRKLTDIVESAHLKYAAAPTMRAPVPTPPTVNRAIHDPVPPPPTIVDSTLPAPIPQTPPIPPPATMDPTMLAPISQPQLAPRPTSPLPITEATIAFFQKYIIGTSMGSDAARLSPILSTSSSSHPTMPEDDDHLEPGDQDLMPPPVADPPTQLQSMAARFIRLQALAKAQLAPKVPVEASAPRPTPWHRTPAVAPSGPAISNPASNRQASAFQSVSAAPVLKPSIVPEVATRPSQDARTPHILQHTPHPAPDPHVRWDPSLPTGVDPDVFSGLSPTFIRSCNIHQRPTVQVPDANRSPDGVDMFDQADPAPAWDTYDRTAHKTPIRSHAAALAAHRHLPPRQGYFAAYFQVAPDELCVDSYTNTVPPWLAIHPKVGTTIMNYPVVLDVTIMDPELFFTGFRDQYRNDQLKHFLSGFPKYVLQASFFDYHEAVVRYCMVYGCFVAPIHTLRPGQPLGTWFLHPRLPHAIRTAAQTLAPTLAMALTSTHSGLATDPWFTPFLQGGNGHLIMLHLAGAAGHPLLTAQGMIPPDPTQRPDQSLVQYLTAWTRHLKHHLLVGTVYSDRHYLDQVLNGMHPSLRAQFDSEVADRKNMSPYGTPLPDSLQPGSLLMTFHGRAAQLGHPEYTTKSPRELREASQAVRMIDTTDVAIHALGTARLCSLCSDPGHLLRDCPFQAKLNDPAIRKAIGLPALKQAPFKLRQITDEFPDSEPDATTASFPAEAFDTPQDF
jgi:hypothetical protein